MGPTPIPFYIKEKAKFKTKDNFEYGRPKIKYV